MNIETRKKIGFVKREKGYWLNTKYIKEPKAPKPCHKCGFCPYGQMVEEFPIKAPRSKYSCHVFGHDCPVYYHAEPWNEIDWDKPETKP